MIHELHGLLNLERLFLVSEESIILTPENSVFWGISDMRAENPRGREEQTQGLICTEGPRKR